MEVLNRLRRVPFTVVFLTLFLIVGTVSESWFIPADEQEWFPLVATGLPAFEAGRWWTILTSPFFLSPPWSYLIMLPFLIVSLSWAEWRLGTKRLVIVAVGGHLVGVFGAAGICAVLVNTGSSWGMQLAATLDVGPSCMAFAALVFAIATLPSPWRMRGRVAILLWAAISLLYLGQIYDVEHGVTMLAALVLTPFLPKLRHPIGRPTVRERRLIAFWTLLAIGTIEIIDLLIPFDGPLGPRNPTLAFWDTALDVVVILLVADGIRKGYRIAWIFTFLLSAVNLLSAALSAISIPVLIDLGLIQRPSDVLGQYVVSGILWAGLLAYIGLNWRSFGVPIRGSRRRLATTSIDRAELDRRIRQFGGGTISWMATWPENTGMAAGDGAIAYQIHAATAIMLGDPIGRKAHAGEALESFVVSAQQAGLVPCAFSVGSATETAKPEGWRSIVVAEDSIVDLAGLSFKGKRWNNIRTALNRAAREGIEFRLVHLTEQPRSLIAQVRDISERWSGDKGLPEMRFTLGTVEEALDPECLVGIAIDTAGKVHGVTSWLPIFDTQQENRIAGWTLDLMRKSDGGFGPVMEFLIGSAAREFAEQGYDFLSLSGVPLLRSAEESPNPVYQVLDRIAELIEPLYGFRSLARFKQQFNPRHEPLYLLYRDEGDLPRIGLALTRAYLPDANLRDLLAHRLRATQSTAE